MALTVRRQKEFVRHVMGGMSPVMACRRLGISLDSVRLTLAIDSRFRRKCNEVPETLTENVLSSLYANAMKGTVSAQSIWLKEEAARKAARKEEVALGPEELLAELERLTAMFKSFGTGTDSK